MNIGKKIIIGSILLLLSTTPALASIEVNKSTYSPTMLSANYGENHSYSLGILNVTHQPFWWRFFTYKGAVMKFTPPVNLTFQFPEVGGLVRMNFTITVYHHLNMLPPGYFIKPRYTLIDYAYISYKGTDYFIKFHEKQCLNASVEQYTVYLPPEEQKAGLPTNGSSLSVKFSLYAGVDAGVLTVKGPDGNPTRLGRQPTRRLVDSFNITIVPIQDP